MPKPQPSAEARVVAGYLVTLMTEGLNRATTDPPTGDQLEVFREALAQELDATETRVLGSLSVPHSEASRKVRELAAEDVGIGRARLRTYDAAMSESQMPSTGDPREDLRRQSGHAADVARITPAVFEKWSRAMRDRQHEVDIAHSGHVLSFGYDVPDAVAVAAQKAGIASTFPGQRMPMKSFFEFGGHRAVFYAPGQKPVVLMGPLQPPSNRAMSVNGV